MFLQMIDESEKNLREIHRFKHSKENHHELLEEADMIYQKICGIFEQNREILLQKNVLDAKIHFNLFKIQLSKADQDAWIKLKE